MNIFTLIIFFLCVNQIVQSCKTQESVDIVLPSKLSRNKTDLNIVVQEHHKNTEEINRTICIFNILTFTLVALIYVIGITYITFYHYTDQLPM